MTAIRGEEGKAADAVSGDAFQSFEPFCITQNLSGAYSIVLLTFLCEAEGEPLTETNEATNIQLDARATAARVGREASGRLVFDAPERTAQICGADVRRDNMARQPQQIHVFLYRLGAEGYEYAVMQRSDARFCWQGVCGGVEDDETLEQSARRELFEEAGITETLPLYPLQSMSYLPLDVFSSKYEQVWGRDVIVVPMYFFAMPFEGEIVLSDEHTEVRWLPYQQAHDLICYHDQQTALYELNQRLLRSNMLPIS